GGVIGSQAGQILEEGALTRDQRRLGHGVGSVGAAQEQSRWARIKTGARRAMGRSAETTWASSGCQQWSSKSRVAGGLRSRLVSSHSRRIFFRALFNSIQPVFRLTVFSSPERASLSLWHGPETVPQRGSTSGSWRGSFRRRRRRGRRRSRLA